MMAIITVMIRIAMLLLVFSFDNYEILVTSVIINLVVRVSILKVKVIVTHV